MPEVAPILATKAVTKRFPGVLSLDAVDFAARPGEIHALMGENGAGKSTLIKVLTGVYQPDGGQILLGGQPIHPRSPLHAQHLGIATVYQEVNLIPGLTVAENIFLGRFPRRFGGWGGVHTGAMKRGAQEALARLDIQLDVTRPLGSYAVGIQQMVAIARSLSMDAKVLILDEPTSSLDRPEVDRLFAAMRRLRDAGLALVFVTHFMDQVYAVSDRITILRNGRLVSEHLARELPRIELVGKMVGRDPAELQHKPAAGGEEGAVASAAPLVEAKNLSRKGAINPLDLTIGKGQVVGLAGLLGSGRTETARLLFAADKHDTGTISVEGKPARLTSPRKAIALGFAFLPEDRKVAGIFPDLSVRENIVVALQAKRGWFRPLSGAKQRQIAHEYIEALRIKTSDAEKPIRLLSGGNQQKAILARWLCANPTLLILDEPTRGIDIGAKAEISALIERLRAQGLSLLFISSEVEEVARLCQKVIVLRDHNKVGEIHGAEVSEQSILARIAG